MVTFLIRSCLTAWLLGFVWGSHAASNPASAGLEKADAVLLDMANAFQKNDRKKSGLISHRPFFERRVPGVAPWRALNFGFDLQIT